MTVYGCSAPTAQKGTSLTTTRIQFVLSARIALSQEQDYVKVTAKHPLAITSQPEAPAELQTVKRRGSTETCCTFKKILHGLKRIRNTDNISKAKKNEKENLGVRSQSKLPIKKKK
ncbi:peptide hydrolase [Trypanosoma cruzi]|nr:peptide hydrolase [Trypanosoma cruzi]